MEKPGPSSSAEKEEEEEGEGKRRRSPAPAWHAVGRGQCPSPSVRGSTVGKRPDHPLSVREGTSQSPRHHPAGSSGAFKRDSCNSGTWSNAGSQGAHRGAEMKPKGGGPRGWRAGRRGLRVLVARWEGTWWEWACSNPRPLLQSTGVKWSKREEQILSCGHRKVSAWLELKFGNPREGSCCPTEWS